MNTVRKVICEVLIMLVVAPWLAGCAPVPGVAEVVGPGVASGQVEAIFTGTSLWVLDQARQGIANTFILQDPKTLQTFFAVPMPSMQGWGSLVLDFSKKQPVLNWVFCSKATGTFYGCSDMADLVTRALEQGWNFIKPKDLPPELGGWITQASSWLQRVESIHMPALVVPMGAFDINLLPTPVVR